LLFREYDPFPAMTSHFDCLGAQSFWNQKEGIPDQRFGRIKIIHCTVHWEGDCPKAHHVDPLVTRKHKPTSRYVSACPDLDYFQFVNTRPESSHPVRTE
jgi:hypothetical protein